MNVHIQIIAHRANITYAEMGNVDQVDVTARHVEGRKAAHMALDKVLDALGVPEDRNDS